MKSVIHPDELSYEGKVRAILEFPLKEHFEHQQSYPSVFSSEGIQMSANWRGHRATLGGQKRDAPAYGGSETLR